MNQHRSAFARVLLVVLIATLPAAMFASDRKTETIANASGGGAAISWHAAVTGYDRIVLLVSLPSGESFTREFPAGSNPSFSIQDLAGSGAQDGVYGYELRIVPKISAAVRKQLQDARNAGDSVAIASIQRAAGLADAVVQSGAFTIANGQILSPNAVEHSSTGSGDAAAMSTARPGFTPVPNQVIAEDLIVQGSECVGLDCVSGESFGFDTIRLKENNLRIHFEDTSTSAGFPANDWRFVANDTASGGQSYMAIEDSTAAKVPFKVEAGSPTNTLYVDSTGNVGIQTSAPALDVHIAASDTPAIRLEQNNSGGFTAETWDIGGNEANFFIRDLTGGSLLPFRIRPGAPTSSIDIAASGNVGIGTSSPAVRLDVRAATATSDVFSAFGIDPVNGPSFNVGYAGGSIARGAGFMNVRPDASASAPNPSLRFLIANVERMILDNEGFIGLGGVANPANPIQHSSGALLTTGGVWTNSSSRSMKQDVKDLDSDDALTTLGRLTPVTYAYKVAPDDLQVGFIAEDVPELVATSDRKGLSPMDIVAVLTKVVQEQQKTISQLNSRLDDLERQKN